MPIPMSAPTKGTFLNKFEINLTLFTIPAAFPAALAATPPALTAPPTTFPATLAAPLTIGVAAFTAPGTSFFANFKARPAAPLIRFTILFPAKVRTFLTTEPDFFIRGAANFNIFLPRLKTNLICLLKRTLALIIESLTLCQTLVNPFAISSNILSI